MGTSDHNDNVRRLIDRLVSLNTVTLQNAREATGLIQRLQDILQNDVKVDKPAMGCSVVVEVSTHEGKKMARMDDILVINENRFALFVDMVRQKISYKSNKGREEIDLHSVSMGGLAQRVLQILMSNPEVHLSNSDFSIFLYRLHPDYEVTPAALWKAICEIRKTIGDNPSSAHRWIITARHSAPSTTDKGGAYYFNPMQRTYCLISGINPWVSSLKGSGKG